MKTIIRILNMIFEFIGVIIGVIFYFALVTILLPYAVCSILFEKYQERKINKLKESNNDTDKRVSCCHKED